MIKKKVMGYSKNQMAQFLVVGGKMAYSMGWVNS